MNTTYRPEEGLLSAIAAAGLPPLTATIKYGGAFTRWGDKKGSSPYWLVAYPLNNSHVAAVFGDWRTGSRITYRSWGNGHPEDPAEAQRLLDELTRRQKLADEEADTNKAATAKHDSAIWELLPTEGDSAYLTRKKVGGYGIRYGADHYGKFIAVPMLDANGTFKAFQRIYEDGRKHFPKGAAKKGAYHLIGALEPSGVLYLAEGYATAATVHEATGKAVSVCFDAGNLRVVADAIKEVFPDLQLIVAADNDQWKAAELDSQGKKKGNAGIKAAYAVADAHPGTKLAIPNFENLDTSSELTDFNDLATLTSLDNVRRQIEKAFTPKKDDRAQPKSSAETPALALIMNKMGEPRALIANVVEVLAKDSRWKDVIGYDEFSGYAVLMKRPPYDKGTGIWEKRNIVDSDASLTAVWLQTHYQLPSPSPLVNEGLQVVALDNRFHPVKEYLESLQWDGVARIDTWAIDYFGAQDSVYVRTVSGKWLIQAVARIYIPGCQADSVLVLEGMQGLGKSTFWRVLASDEYFTDSLPDMHSKDAQLHMAGKWIGELAELAALARSDVEAIKNYTGKTQDYYRPPYGRRPITVPRQCVFAATTNAEEYLKDTTGNRRFWPVKALTRCDIPKVIANRDQIWAEAVHRFKQGEPWHLSQELEAIAAEEQLARVDVDEWEPKVLAYIAGMDEVTSSDLLINALNIPDPKDWTQTVSKRVVGILRKNGWIKKNLRRGGIQGKTYVRIKSPTPPETPPSGGATPFRPNDTPKEGRGITENASKINAATPATPATPSMETFITTEGSTEVTEGRGIGSVDSTRYIKGRENTGNTGSTGSTAPIPFGNQPLARYSSATRRGSATPLADDPMPDFGSGDPTYFESMPEFGSCDAPPRHCNDCRNLDPCKAGCRFRFGVIPMEQRATPPCNGADFEPREVRP